MFGEEQDSSQGDGALVLWAVLETTIGGMCFVECLGSEGSGVCAG